MGYTILKTVSQKVYPTKGWGTHFVLKRCTPPRGGVHTSFSKGVPHQGVGYTLRSQKVYPTKGWGTHFVLKRCTPPRGGVHTSFLKSVPHQGVGYTLRSQKVYPTKGWGTHFVLKRCTPPRGGVHTSENRFSNCVPHHFLGYTILQKGVPHYFGNATETPREFPEPTKCIYIYIHIEICVTMCIYV